MTTQYFKRPDGVPLKTCLRRPNAEFLFVIFLRHFGINYVFVANVSAKSVSISVIKPVHIQNANTALIKTTK